MRAYLGSLIWSTAIVVSTSVVACSSGELDVPDANVAQAVTVGSDGNESPDTLSSETGAHVDAQVFVSEGGFVKVGIGTNVDDVYAPGLDPSCVSPGPGYPPPVVYRAESPPEPGYLPEGLALSEELRVGDRHFGNSYVAAGDVNSGVRISVSHGVCGKVNAPADEYWELVTVAGHWGILVRGACVTETDIQPENLADCWDPDFALSLVFETGQGYVEVVGIDSSSGQYRVDKAELARIAASMPIPDTSK